jgi:polysaccharide export outer membrane protein
MRLGRLAKQVEHFRQYAMVASVFLLGGCSAMPANGPAGTDVLSASTDVAPAVVDSLPYALVRLTPETVRSLEQYEPRFYNSFTDGRPPQAFRFGVGDIVSVTIFEGGHLVPTLDTLRTGNFVTLPNQAVDNKGNISVPYAGVIRAKGQTPDEVRQTITDALKDKALDPQIVVALADQKTSLISVLGEVGRPDRFPASMAGERILDIIARAGGAKAQGFDAFVMLERQGRRVTLPFGALLYQPSNNIYVHAGDTIYLYTEPQTFLAFGANGGAGGGGTGIVNGTQLKFDAWRITLAEAVAKAGGLSDALADPAFVFLYRGEPREVAQRLGVDCSKFAGPIIPIIYNVNLRDPAGYFLAKSFEMRNKDVLYISNATAVQTTKFLFYLRTIMATVNDPILYAINFYALKAAINGAATITTITAPAPITVAPR